VNVEVRVGERLGPLMVRQPERYVGEMLEAS